ncbi:uncharacterized protein EI97DRAFT_444766 [Westerdykella ornata]|uniref:Uncharacterized protein n=1 Tax=Westerdykella ornata TaxID=318751 RepID=A0A6A6JCI7_WESOR|nr:uncharacterized protein EI97DRAFT_444766 [Westerdykella ornata]KAF2273718.1 hypothetical protein EI97DRAFT_444766 [Westerdykella ornata]
MATCAVRVEPTADGGSTIRLETFTHTAPHSAPTYDCPPATRQYRFGPGIAGASVYCGVLLNRGVVFNKYDQGGRKPHSRLRLHLGDSVHTKRGSVGPFARTCINSGTQYGVPVFQKRTERCDSICRTLATNSSDDWVGNHLEVWNLTLTDRTRMRRKQPNGILTCPEPSGQSAVVAMCTERDEQTGLAYYTVPPF